MDTPYSPTHYFSFHNPASATSGGFLTQGSASSSFHGRQDQKLLCSSNKPVCLIFISPIHHQLNTDKIYPFLRFCFLPLLTPLSFDWMIICSCLHKHFLSHNYWHIHRGTLGPAGWAAQKVPVSRLSWGQFKLVIKLTCSVTFSFQAVVSSSESVAYCVSLRLRQCANNYREPEACVCIWRTSCAVGGMCATAMIQAHRCN